MRKTILFFISLLTSFVLQAQVFSNYFTDKTLRLDYLFTGNAAKQEICLSQLSSLPTWAGRRHHLSELPLAGNGQIVMKDAASGKVIYRTSFSSLFQEWLETDEAQTTTKGFENTYLVPFPLKTAEITVTLFTPRKEVRASMTHVVNPADILINAKGTSHITPHKYLLKNGSPEQCIDVAIVAEGYTADEAEIFYADAQAAADEILSYEPFCRYRDRFNIVSVALPSADSGVSVPLEGEWKETPLHSNFSTFYMDRYLTTLHLKDLHDALAGIPYEHIVILANTDVYGGGGIYNSYTLTTAHHSEFRPVVVHEFGHSFGALADEYYYDDMYVEYYYPDVEPWEQNITTLYDFGGKWENLLDAGTPVPTPATRENMDRVGVYEGAGYQSKGVYRGYQQCRMLDNSSESFCPVCRQAIERMILFNIAGN